MSTSSEQISTEQWARSLGISTALTPPPFEDDSEVCPISARDVAIRAIVLQGVVAAAFEVNPAPIIEWFQQQSIWTSASPLEQRFLTDPGLFDHAQRLRLRWRKEAQWALLWAMGKVEYLGLPTHECDTKTIVDEIIPALGSDIEPFLSSATLRPPGEVSAESMRHYDLWCRYIQDRKPGAVGLPLDLLLDVLYQREYVFEWLFGLDPWDNVSCDA
jgi:hypothetical protein